MPRFARLPCTAIGSGSGVFTSIGTGLESIASSAMVRRNQFSTWHFSDVVTNEALIGRVLAEGLAIWVQAPH